MKIDFHSHILPNIDDGSRSIEESLAILDLMAADGVDIVAATPHFYCSETTIDGFLERRQDAYERLKPHLKPEHPKIILGAEVLYDNVLTGGIDISPLCLEGTDYILLEMPYMQLTNDIISGVERIIESDVKVYVAHIERYLNFTSYQELEKLMRLDVLGQINARSLMSFTSKRRCFKLIKNGYVHVMGTDFHRTDSGHVVLGEAEKIIEKKFGSGIISDLRKNGEMLLGNCDIEKILT